MLGSTIQVHGDPSALSADHDEYDGTVTAAPKPAVYAAPDGTRVIVFHIEASAKRGKVPTGDWWLETENAIPIPAKTLTDGDIAKPPLGPEVSGHAKGFITFEIPAHTQPTILDLYATANTSTKPVAQWSLGELPAAVPYTPPTTPTPTSVNR